MYEYLIDHAVQNVWCNPEQDRHVILRPQRISPVGGYLNSAKIMIRTIALPVRARRFHVFQVGQVMGSILGLLDQSPTWLAERWIRVSDMMPELRLMVDVYDGYGVCIPRTSVWCMLTQDRDLVFAVGTDIRLVSDLTKADIYVRLYTNAYFQTDRADATVDMIRCDGMRISSIDDIMRMRAGAAVYSGARGFVRSYHNGQYVPEIDVLDVRVGDVVEWVYDSSVKRVVEWTVRDLHAYQSTLDGAFKYLLHYPADDVTTIEYLDDCDFYVIRPTGATTFIGQLYPQNQEDSVRMVTHRDYAISVQYFEAIARSMADPGTDIRDFKIQLVVRESGYQRALQFDANRVFELYRLSDTDVLAAMVDTQSVVPEWTAATLEASGYTEIMRSQYLGLTIPMIERGYGYNAISTILGATPQRVTESRVRLPRGLHTGCTAYEYDAGGVLLGWYHSTGSEYICSHVETTLVECLYGHGAYDTEVVWGVDGLIVPTECSYRVYLSRMIDGAETPWQDVTGSDLYTIKDGAVSWIQPETNQLLQIRTDRTFLAYDLLLHMVAGTLYFTLSEWTTRYGRGVDAVLPVPLGDLDIILNGYSLIRGLDYIVSGQMVYIVNRRYIRQPYDSAPQMVHVRYVGFAEPNGDPEPIDDWGYIQHGVMSNNVRYDVRDDRVMRMTVGGRVMHRDDLVFSERHEGISILNPINGLPYQIKDMVVPCDQYINANTYALRAVSKVTDTHVSDYMTLHLPQPHREPVSAIIRRWELVSPFVAHVLNDLVTDLFPRSMIMKNLTDLEILDICRPYEFLLRFDPARIGIDPRYIVIYPHASDTVQSLDAMEYRFLSKVVKLYFQDTVDLTALVSIRTI